MKEARTKRIAAGQLALVLALSLVSGLSLPARAAGKTDAEALRWLESVPRETPRDPFGFRPGSSGVSLMGTYPSSFDLRHVYISEEYPDFSFVTPVKFQNPFGTCWGFAAIAAAEVSLLTSGIAGQEGFAAAADPEKGWRELDLSEKHLAYFVHETDHGFDPDDPHCQNGEGSHVVGDPESSDRYDTGGNVFYTTGMFASGTGPVLEYADPQLEYHGKYKCVKYRTNAADKPYCYSENDDWNIDKGYHHAQNYVLEESCMLPSPGWTESEAERAAANNAIKGQLLEGRAVTASFYADNSSPNQEQTSQYINTENWAHYTYEAVGTNHAVCIIGWDDNYPRENFAHRVEGMDDAKAYGLTTPARDGAWLVKNSWGSQENEFPNKGQGWGLYQGQDRGVLNPETGKYEYKAGEGAVQTGYFWLSYEDATICRTESFVFDSAIAREGYFLYQYDFMPVLWFGALFSPDRLSMANVFTAETAGRLDAVSCQTSEPGTKVIYEVYLLEDPAEEEDLINPTDGKPVWQAEHVYEYGGFHRAELDEDERVPLREGQLFSVVVTQVRGGETEYPYCLSVQTSTNEAYLQVAPKNEYGKGIINPNESLFCEYDEEKQMDVWYDMGDEDTQDMLKGVFYGEKSQYYDIDNFPIKAYVANLGPAANWLTYTGEAQELITPSSAAPEGYTAEYSTDGGDWSEEIPVGTEVGSYTVETRYVNDNDVSDIISAEPVTVDIQPVPVVITAKDQTIQIGDDPAWTADSYTVAGPEGVTLAKEPDVRYEIYQNDKKTGVEVEVSKDTVMDYNIVPYGAVLDVEDPDIYEIDYRPGILTVKGKPVTVKAKDVTIYTGDPVPEWTADSYTVEGLDEGDTLSIQVAVMYYTLSNKARTAGQIDTGKPGKYGIATGGVRVDGKYTISYLNGTLTVAERPEPSSGGGGGSGGGSATASNPVMVPTAAASVSAHGKVTSSASNARAGDKVTLTLTPDEGYVTAGVTVIDKNGKEVPVTQNADGTWSFTMPATAVTITPEFEETTTPDNPENPDTSGGDVSDRFKDVSKTAWYHDAVQWAVDQGIMNGVSADRFAPDDTTTRAMVVTMLWRLAGEPASSTPAPFTDVKDGAWYADAVAWAAETGAVNGTSADTFSPNTPVTREQLAAILYRYAQAQGKGFTGEWAFPLDYPDAADVSEWADEAMHWMTMHGIITGMGDGTLAPKDNATRAQIATMFMRFADAMEE